MSIPFFGLKHIEQQEAERLDLETQNQRLCEQLSAKDEALAREHKRALAYQSEIDVHMRDVLKLSTIAHMQDTLGGRDFASDNRALAKGVEKRGQEAEAAKAKTAWNKEIRKLAIGLSKRGDLLMARALIIKALRDELKDRLTDIDGIKALFDSTDNLGPQRAKTQADHRAERYKVNLSRLSNASMGGFWPEEQKMARRKHDVFNMLKETNEAWTKKLKQFERSINRSKNVSKAEGKEQAQSHDTEEALAFDYQQQQPQHGSLAQIREVRQTTHVRTNDCWDEDATEDAHRKVQAQLLWERMDHTLDCDRMICPYFNTAEGCSEPCPHQLDGQRLQHRFVAEGRKHKRTGLELIDFRDRYANDPTLTWEECSMRTDPRFAWKKAKRSQSVCPLGR